MKVGVIDAGTNSIHLVIATMRPEGGYRIILRQQRLAQLGEGGLARRRLTPQAMRRAMRVLAGYATVITRCGVDRIEAVATSAVREAANGRVFVRRVRRKLHLPLRIISGVEEAALIYRGVVSVNRLRRPLLVVTIGGGSAQVVAEIGRAHV